MFLFLCLFKLHYCNCSCILKYAYKICAFVAHLVLAVFEMKIEIYCYKSNSWIYFISISIIIGQLRNIFKSKRPRSSSVFGCSINWPDWNVTIIFRFFQRCLKWQPKRCFNADGKYVLRLLNVVIHEHQFKRKGIYCKFHFDKEAYTKPKNVRIFTL